MNILITKMMTARFTTNTDRERLCGGFDAISYLMQRIAEAYPQHTFYYIGASDLSVNHIATAPNLKDLYTPIKAYAKENGYDPIGIETEKFNRPFYAAAVEYCQKNGLHFDLALYQYEQTLPIAHYAAGYISERTHRPLRTLVSQRHAAHAFVLANDLKVPMVLIIDDPRQFNHIPADITPPIKILGQCAGVDHSRYYTDKENKAEHPVEMEYAEIEKFWLLKKPRVDFSNPDEIKPSPFETYKKDIEFTVTLNGNFDRLEFVKNWLFKFRPDLRIYGKWDSGELGKKVAADGLADHFIFRGMSEMEDIMWRTKYTFVPPPGNKNKNFVTQKAYSMLYYGIVPFWGKDSYDIDGYYKDIPDYVKVSSPEEMWEKIDFLNKNPNEYKKLINKLYEALRPEYFGDEFIHRIFDPILQK